MKEIKPCPFCGGHIKDDGNGSGTHAEKPCPLSFISYSVDQWNMRPQEQENKNDWQDLGKAVEFLRTHRLDLQR